MKVEVRSFRINEKIFCLKIDTDTDDTSIETVNGTPIGLTFDSSGYVFYKDNQIGYIRHGFNEEGEFLHFIFNKETINTNVSQNRCEAYLDAEVVITKWLVENKHISIGE